MKKLLTLILLAGSLSAQAQKMEKYCDMVATSVFLSRKVTVSVDYGELQPFFRDTRLKDDDGRLKRFNSVVDALNYLGTQGWKLVNAFAVSEGSSGRVFHFYMKKEYDASEIDTTKTN